MIEYTDGSFGPIGDQFLIIQKFQEMVEVNQFPKAIHFGSERALLKVKNEKSIKDRLSQLEQEITTLKIVKSDNISIPTLKEINKFGGLNK